MLTLLEPRTPLHSPWPGRRAKIATVISDGPSALEYRHRLAGAARGPVVAVNRAIRYSGDVPIDFWATADNPTNLWEWSRDYRHPDLRYFTVNGALLSWKFLGVPCASLYSMEAAKMGAFTGADGIDNIVPTLFHCLSWLLRLGVERVRLLGCDMKGYGNPDLNWQDEEKDGYDLRWAVERFFLSSSMKHYRAKGARIDRWDLQYLQ